MSDREPPQVGDRVRWGAPSGTFYHGRATASRGTEPDEIRLWVEWDRSDYLDAWIRASELVRKRDEEDA